MKLKVGDKVRVMVGKDKGKEGKITHVFKNENKVIVEGLNMVKKHRKPNNSNETGGIIETEAKINASNVMFLIDNKPSRKIDRTVKEKKSTSKKAAPKKEVAKTEEPKKAKKTTKKTSTSKKEAK